MKLNDQLKTLIQKDHAKISVIRPHKLWEISIPEVLATTFTQTSFVLSRGDRFDRLTDNGSFNNTAAFKRSQSIRQNMHQLRIKDHIHVIKNRFQAIQFPRDQEQGLIESVHLFKHYCLTVNQILQRNI